MDFSDITGMSSNSLWSILNITNPAYPLKFETFGTDEKVDQNFIKFKDHIGYITMGNVLPVAGCEIVSDWMCYASKKAHKAAEVAIAAYSCADPVEGARQALEISPICPEAYNILAMFQATTYEEALEYYNKAVVLSPKVSPQYFKEATTNGKCWIYHQLRCYFRAIHGQANTLRKMGRNKEALEKYQLLNKLDSNLYNFSSYANYRYHVPEVYLKLGDEEGGLKYMKDDQNKECFKKASSTAAWTWSKALMDYRLKRTSRGFCHEYFKRFDKNYRSDPEFSKVNEGVLLKAIQSSPHTLEFLSGERKLPNIRIPLVMGNEATLSNAALYCSSNLELWQDTPGAIEWAQKNARTFFCLLILQKDYDACERLGVECTLENFKLLISKGIYLEARISTTGRRLIHEATAPLQIEHVKALLSAGAKPSPDCDTKDHSPQPLHTACYYDVGTEIIKLLCEAGADPSDNKGCCYSPIEMAAEQGNIDNLKVAFSYLPNYLKHNQKLLEFLMSALLLSTVYKCMMNEGPKCQRCKHDNQPHSQNVNFIACIDFILEAGYHPTSYLINLATTKSSNAYF